MRPRKIPNNDLANKELYIYIYISLHDSFHSFINVKNCDCSYRCSSCGELFEIT